MTAIGALLEHPGAQAWAWALVHFLWQGAAIGVALWAIWRVSSLSAQARYAAGVAGLALMLVLPIATVVVIGPGGAATADTPVAAADLPPVPALAITTSLDEVGASSRHLLPTGRDPFEPFVVALWLAGVIVLSVRLIGGWIVVRGVARRGVRPVAGDIASIARAVGDRLGMSRVVRLFESTTVAVPVTIGWLKPVVLLPMSAMSGLSNAQVEALLAHELAHVRRHDYLVNLLQSAVETLLFYHPAVWWVSKRVRVEREHCCDDVAVTVCDRVVYVRALTDLAALTTPRLALAATDGSLVRRVKRLLGSSAEGEASSGWAAIMLVTLLAGGAVPVAIAAMAEDDRAASGAAVVTDPQRLRRDPAIEVVPDGRRPIVDVVTEEVPIEVAPEALAQDQQRGTVEELLRREAEADRLRQHAEMALGLEALKLEQQKARVQSEAQQTMLLAELEDAKRRLETIKRRVDVGTAPPEALSELQGNLRVLEAKLEGLQLERRLVEREYALKQQQLMQRHEFADRQVEIAQERRAAASSREERLTALTREYDRLSIEYDRTQALAQRGLTPQSSVNELRQQLINLERTIEAVRLELDLLSDRREPSATTVDRLRETVDRLRDQRRAVVVPDRLPTVTLQREDSAPAVTVALGPQERAATGHIVALEIQNEPVISRHYTIASDGTIRLPLLGAINVAGMTARDIQDVVRRQLSDRRLAPGATVEVTLRRRN